MTGIPKDAEQTSETLAIFRDLADTDSRIRGVTTQRAAAIEPLLDHIDALTGENERLRRELSVIDQGMHKALVEERAALKEALRFYADPSSWFDGYVGEWVEDPDDGLSLAGYERERFQPDGGSVARAALEATDAGA